uniref:Phosphoprotein membrane anchor with glycosphingolipid microdomains 1 n=2 Tax=Latimeria chalumnae TaxID=7897 RepID=H3A8V3_LATCH
IGDEEGLLSSGQPQVVLWGTLAAITSFLLLNLLVFLCTSCEREQKAKTQTEDHEILMNMPSDKETFSHSVTSLGTDPPVSSCQNGELSNGDVLSEDNAGTNTQPSEEMKTSLPDLISQQDSMGKPLRYPQSRELPSIPPNSSVEGPKSSNATENDQALVTDVTYEVLKDSSSQDNIIEDSLYETVKELKEECGPARNDTASLSRPSTTAEEVEAQSPENAAGATQSAEYASVDWNKKSHRSQVLCAGDRASANSDEEAPPPVPTKILDENENVQNKGTEGEHLKEASEVEKKRLSYRVHGDGPPLTEEEISAMYSTVNRPAQSVKSLECDYVEVKALSLERTPSMNSDLYATVRDFEKEPNVLWPTPSPSDQTIQQETDPGYEPISSVKNEDETTESQLSASPATDQKIENDYEIISEFQKDEITRL